MPVMRVRVRNMSALQAKVKRLPLQVQAGVFTSFTSLAPLIKADIQDELRKPKSGPIKTRYRPKRRVKTSLPGEAPAEDLGLLVASIDVDVDPVQFNMIISANAFYAKFLELGTRRMLPRPFLVPALTRWRQRIIDAMQIAIRNNLDV